MTWNRWYTFKSYIRSALWITPSSLSSPRLCSSGSPKHSVLRDNVIRGISGLFVFTMLWANRTLAAFTPDNVPQFQVFLTA